MDQLVRLQLVEFAKEDAAETITFEQSAHWYDIDSDDRSQIPKALRPDGGYFDNAIAFSEDELSSEEVEECWELYQQTYHAAMVRGIRAIQLIPYDDDVSVETENNILTIGAESARDAEE